MPQKVSSQRFDGDFLTDEELEAFCLGMLKPKADIVHTWGSTSVTRQNSRPGTMCDDQGYSIF